MFGSYIPTVGLVGPRRGRLVRSANGFEDPVVSAFVSAPRVALASDCTRLACRSPSYKMLMKFRRSCLRSHRRMTFAGFPVDA